MMFRHKDDARWVRLAAQLATDRRRRDADRLSQPGSSDIVEAHRMSGICAALTTDDGEALRFLRTVTARPPASNTLVWIAVRR